jgi:hypothetical protein
MFFNMTTFSSLKCSCSLGKVVEMTTLGQAGSVVSTVLVLDIEGDGELVHHA